MPALDFGLAGFDAFHKVQISAGMRVAGSEGLLGLGWDGAPPFTELGLSRNANT